MHIATKDALIEHLQELDTAGFKPSGYYILEWVGIQLISPSREVLEGYI